MTSRVVTVTYIRTTAEAVWEALITPDMIRSYWNGAVHSSSWERGAPWILTLPDGRIADTGEVLEFDENRRLSVSWRNEFKEELLAEGYSRCLWEIEPDEGNVVKLTVTHEIDCPNSKFIAAAANSWPAIVAGLKTLLETRIPLEHVSPLAIEEVARGAVLIASLFDLLTAPLVKEYMSIRSECSGPYAVRFHAYEHAKFVAVLRGRFYLQIEGETTRIRVRRGDAYILTSGKPYRIFNEDVPETDAATLFSADRRLDGIVRWGDGAADTITVGCRVVFNPDAAAALRSRLPSFIRLPGGSAEACRFRAILKLLCGEPEGAPGAAAAAEKYIGILLLQVLRHLLACDRGRKTSGAHGEFARKFT